MSVTLLKKSIFSLLLCFGVSTTLFATPPELTQSLSMVQIEKLTASDAAADDRFGNSVAISGNTIVIGAVGDDGGGNNSGSAYIYERDAATGFFEQRAKLTASDAAADDRFGSSVAISGNTVVIGTVFDNDGGTYSGSAYLFEKPAGGWINMTQRAKLTASDAAAGDLFGSSVAISGNTIVIGATGDDDGGASSGSTYLFEKPASGWINMTQRAKLTASDAAAGDLFGSSVAISGDTIVIGAVSDNDSGSAYIYERDTATGFFEQRAKLTTSDAAIGDRFGNSVAISGNTIVIGAVSDNDGGSAYIYERDAATGFFEQRAKLTTSDAAADDRFGSSVAISSDTIVIGAVSDNDGGIYSGSAYLFEKPAGGWINMTQRAKLTASDAAAGDLFGSSVAISGDTIVIGAVFDNDGGNYSGSAYLYKDSASSNVNPAIMMYLLH